MVAVLLAAPGGSSTSDIYFYFGDELGTARVITASDGTVCYDADMYPYGGVRAYNVSCAPNHVFTGKERDSESGLDNFGARYLSSQYGRFMIPDPLGNFVADPTNPQSWNQYSYVRNNPLNLIDPTGEIYCRPDYSDDSGNTSVCDVSDQQYSQNQWSFGAAGYQYFDAGNTLQQDTNSDPNNLTVFDSSLLFQIQQGLATQKANVLAQLNQSPTTQQYLRAIANGLPTVCGGGAFAFGGLGGEAGVANGFVGGIVEYDSKNGFSRGILTEGGIAGNGVGHVSGPNGASQTFAFKEAASVPGVGSGGLVATSSAVGPYAEGEAGPVQGGLGLYVNVTSVAQCHK